MKLLSGSELAGFIKQRHAQQVRALRSRKTFPKLAIVQTKDDPVINTYVNLKQKYGADIDVEVDVHKIKQADATELLNKLSNDDSVHGVIVQLPLEDTSQTEAVVGMVNPTKDVDGLGAKSNFEPATPLAILWLLAAYNVELKDKNVLVVGHGKLVGDPLTKMLVRSNVDVSVADARTTDLKEKALAADIIITATGNPGVLKAHMIKPGAVVVDAGTASEDGKTVGDLAADVYDREDLTVTPKKGGVGPLTVCALFENVIRAASQ